MRVLVCGGREFFDRELLHKILVDFIDEKDFNIISGGATGADTLAVKWAQAHNVPFKVFPADWKSDGRAAGPIRNKRMLEEGSPDIVIAFPGGKGTQNMIRQARNARVKVRVIQPESNAEESVA